MRKLTEQEVQSLKSLVEHCQKEDELTRQRQVLLWRKLKLYWDGFQRLYYSSVARDWRVDSTAGDKYSTYYEKTVNVFGAYLESIIAALSINVPSVRCVPDDAENPLDLATSRAGDQIAKLIAKHNDAPLLWIHALYLLCTEGLIAAHRFSKEDEAFGTYKEKTYRTEKEDLLTQHCPNCNAEVVDENICPRCMVEVDPIPQMDVQEYEVLDKIVDKPKCRQIIQIYGGLYVKIPVYAKTQEDCGYLIWSYETHYAQAKARYNHLAINSGSGYRGRDYWERWGRTSSQYTDAEPDNNVTVHNAWIRPELYHILADERAKEIAKLFPKGVKIVLVGDEFAEAKEDKLDDAWTLTQNPTADFLHYEPLGARLTNIQDITNDLISLTLQTMEHGIGQMFADPAVVNFESYAKNEVAPGSVIPAIPRGGKQLSESFYESRTSNLSREIEPVIDKFQTLGQLVSGALPSLFGGPAPGSSRTAAEYAMSRAQALQRLQTPWKMLTIWWEKVFSKAIPAYMQDMVEDERMVDKDDYGTWINSFIRKSETLGKIGQYRVEGSEQLPVTMAQKKDAITELLQTQHPAILEALTSPENIPLLTQALALPEFKLPNQNDIEKQQEEIQLLLYSQPMPTEMGEMPSIQVEQDLENHLVEAETTRRWLISPAGRLAKVDNPEGYRNVLLHLKMHMQFIMPPPMPEPPTNSPKPKKPGSKASEPIPITEDTDYGPTNTDYPIQ